MIIHLGPYQETVIDPTVRDVYRRWQKYVDRDDLVQEAAVWWYGPGQEYLPRYLTEDENYVRLRRSIWRFLARYAEAEKAHARGYEPIDQYRYTVAEVVVLLPYALDEAGLPGRDGVADGGPAPKGNLAEGGDVLASWIDVRRAVAALADRDQEFLVICDDFAHDWERVGAYTGTQPDSARRRHTRLAERMVRWLNSTNDERNAA